MGNSRDFGQGRLTITPEQVNLGYLKSFLGYPQSQKFPDYILSFLHSALFPGLADLSVQYQYRLLSVTDHIDHENRIIFSGSAIPYFQGPVVYQLLKDCDRCVVFILNVAGTANDDPVYRYLFYCSYNCILQTALDLFKKDLWQIFAVPESYWTKRFAPGYCGWPVEEQKKILALLDPGKMGVRISSCGMLDPSHSITGVFGIRRNQLQTENIPCYTCTSVTCPVHLDFLDISFRA